ncbi:MAG: apolipoprotein N-acyltransferase [Acidobacteria bacterium]|nr:apolipoprotein N-acyltransferase [Acidobacteriota bacterium]
MSARRGFTLGLLTGVVHYGGTVYWTSGTVATFGGLSWLVAIPVAGILVLYMALYVGISSAATAVLIQRYGARGLLLAPAAWVSTEYARAYLFGGFPWIPLGNAVVTLLPIAQLASATGVYGLSWFLATLHALFALVAMRDGRQRLTAGLAALGLVAACALWGAARLSDGRLTRVGEAVKIGLIQGNIPQVEKWDSSRASSIFERYLHMTREAAARGAQFILWPESATPFYFDEDPISALEVRRLVAETRTPLLFGSDEIERGSPARYYNSAFMLDASGSTAAVYRKMFLVPFGEYVPFSALLTFVGPLVEAVSAFSPGQRVTMMPVHGHMVSTAICYEVVYPHLIRGGVRDGSELLTTITNDAWYGETSAPFQHFELASMRAIEQGRYLARAANTGISGIVDPYGRVLTRTELFETTTVVGEVRFIQELTVYARIGDLVAQLAVLLTLIAVGTALWRPRVARA